MKPLTRIDLDLLVLGPCEHPNCDHKDHADPTVYGRALVRYLHGQCHPLAPTWAFYRADGILTVECAVCRTKIAEIKVADS